MELTNEFTVAVSVDEAWKVLTDLERIAPSMPGAELQEVEGDEYRGIVKVKVGPITAQYKGTARFTEVDEIGRRAVILAEGRDTRGQGNASATVTARLEASGDSTRVRVDTDLTITGKVAQFGRGVLADVSTKLMEQFVHNLETDVFGSGGGAAEVPAPPAPESSTVANNGPRRIQSAPAEPVDLLATAGNPVVKRIGPIIGVLVVVLWLLRRRKKKRQ